MDVRKDGKDQFKAGRLAAPEERPAQEAQDAGKAQDGGKIVKKGEKDGGADESELSKKRGLIKC